MELHVSIIYLKASKNRPTVRFQRVVFLNPPHPQATPAALLCLRVAPDVSFGNYVYRPLLPLGEGPSDPGTPPRPLGLGAASSASSSGTGTSASVMYSMPGASKGRLFPNHFLIFKNATDPSIITTLPPPGMWLKLSLLPRIVGASPERITMSHSKGNRGIG